MAGIKYDVKTSLRTSLDGMILQAYFTGALSYLPLASDVELKGETANKAKCSTMALLVLLGLSLVLDTFGILLGMVLLEIWAARLLLYTFVISFSICNHLKGLIFLLTVDFDGLACSCWFYSHFC